MEIDKKSGNHYIGGSVFEYLDIEADRFNKLRQEEKDLYFKNPFDGSFVKVGVAYEQGIMDMLDKISKKKKTRFFITFNDTLDIEDSLTKMDLRVVRYLARRMSYNNKIKYISYADMQGDLASHFRYIKKSIDTLIEKNILKFETDKNRRIYMLNPTYYYKGGLSNIFYTIREFKKFGN